jgi:hypothetical protein
MLVGLVTGIDSRGRAQAARGGSRAKTTTAPDPWLATSSQRALGSMAKLQGDLAAGWQALDFGQAARASVDGKGDQHILAPDRGVDEAPVAADRQLGAPGDPGLGRIADQRQSLDERQAAVAGVPAIGAQFRDQLADHQDQPAVRMEDHVTRPGPGRQRLGGRGRGAQLSAGAIVPVDEQAVGAEVGDQGETPGGIQSHAVGVRALLPRRGARALVGLDRGGRTQARRPPGRAGRRPGPYRSWRPTGSWRSYRPPGGSDRRRRTGPCPPGSGGRWPDRRAGCGRCPGTCRHCPPR